jgi:pSer/pThr/pTyr-binding forkhead associated (FHA) protein
MMGAAPTLNATQTIVPVQCPVCKSHNPPGVMFCVECGLIFDRALPDDVFGAPVLRLPVLVDSSGREHPIRPGENVVGREADILLADPKVSRRHAVIRSLDGGLETEDLGSTNGTTLNGEPLEPGTPRPLEQGDRLAFGGVELVVSLPGVTGKTAMLESHPAGTEASETDSQPEEPPGFEASVAAILIVDGEERPLRAGANSFGRRPGNDIVLADPYVSGRHGTIEIGEGEAFLTDTGSTNGTFVNEQRLEANTRTEIGPDDEIRIGGLTMSIRLLTDESE